MPRRKIDWYGPRLRELREQAGLSQAELGQRISLAGSQINKLETNVNQPTLATALAIAEALSVSITEFIHPSVEKPHRSRPPKQQKAEAAPATPAPPPAEALPQPAQKPARKPRGKTGK